MSDAPSQAKLDEVGEDHILGLVAEGATIGKLGKRFGVSRRTFYNWINAGDGRRGRLEDAKKLAAERYVDAASLVIRKATPENIQVAKEQANHLKWMAAKLDRGTWGEQPQTQINVGLNMGQMHLDALRQVNMQQLPVAEVKELPSGE